MEHDFKTPEDVTDFQSQMAKTASKLSQKEQKKLSKAVADKKMKSVSLSFSDRYKLAWKSVYSKLPKWRQEEIDNQLKTGTLSDKEWDKDFVQRVTALAESDDLQAV
jgi:hypothetical protein